MRTPLLLILAVTAGCVLLFGGSLTGGRFVVDPTWSMDTYHLSLLYERAGHHLAAGHFPFYFPEFSAGYPVAASWMYGLFYPPTALFAALPADAAWSVSAALHLLLAAGGMYLFLRRMLGDPLAAAAGAVVYTFSEFTIGRIIGGHLNLVWPAAWVPWTLWAAGRCARLQRGGMGLFGLTLGIGLVSGHVQIWFYVAPFLILHALLETSAAPSGGRAIAALAGAALLAAGISAVQWVSTAEFAAATGRPGPSGLLEREFAAPLSTLASKVYPGFLGRLPPEDAGGTYWGGGEFAHERVALGGLAVLFLAVSGLLRRGRGRMLWFAAAATGLVLAPGVLYPVSSWVCRVPPFSWSRASARSLLLTVLGVAVLAGHGVRAWRAGELRGRRLGLAIFITAAVAVAALGGLLLWMGGEARSSHLSRTCLPAVLKSVAGLAVLAIGLYLGRRWPRSAPLLPVLLLAVILGTALPPVKTTPSDFYFHDWAASLPADLGESRVYVMWERFPALEREGVRGLRLMSPVDVPWHWKMVRGGSPRHLFWIDLALEVDGFTRREMLSGPPFPSLRILNRAPACGRAMLFRRAEVETDDEVAMARLDAGRRELYLAGPADLPPVPVEPAASPPAGQHVEHRPGPDPNRLTFETSAPGPRWLYVSEKFYPNWRATVDGGGVPRVRANVFGTAIPVPAGDHVVELEFVTAAKSVGLPVSLISLVLCLAAVVPALRAARAPPLARRF